MALDSLRRRVAREAGLPYYTTWGDMLGMVAGATIGRALIGATYACGALLAADIWGAI